MDKGTRGLALAAFPGAAAVLWATKKGVGLSFDSVCYIALARSLAAGRGFSLANPSGGPLPFTHFPPLYPVLLAAPQALGLDVLASIRWLNALLFTCNLILAVLSLRRLAPGRVWPPVLGAVLLLGSVEVVHVHTMAWSEPPFLFFSLAGLLALIAHQERPRPALLVLSAAAAGAAVMTRYAGIAFVAAGAAVLSRRGMRESGAFLAVSGAPIASWLLRNRLVAGDMTGRPWSPHWPQLPPLAEAATPGAFAVAAFLALWLRLPRERRAAWTARLLAPLAFAAAYLGLAVLAAACSTPNLLGPGEYGRVMAPFHVMMVILLVPLAAESVPGRAVRSACAVGAFLLLSRLCFWANEASADGQQYASGRWRSSETILSLRALPPATHIYSNSAPAVYLYAGRDTVEIPEEVEFGTLNSAYGVEMAAVREDFRRGAVLAYFSGGDDAGPEAEKRLARSLGVMPIRTLADGRLYAAARR